MMAQLSILPILVPLAAAALQLLAGARRARLQAVLGLSACGVLVIVAALLMVTVSGPGVDHTVVYRIGDWPASFAIVLVADRLSVLMLLLAAVVALTVLPYALGRWESMGAYFHPQFQWFLLGLDGVFLTGDLFNLFVFFEILLTASYALVLHGSGPRRVAAGLHYMAINLAASLLFLIGVGLIFGVTGTLNMASLARLIPTLPAGGRALLHAGAALLGVAFLIKTAIWPLGFWLPRTYSAATPPVAAMFALMTKLGIYVLLRLTLLLFGAGAGVASAHFGSQWLLWGGIATLAVGTIGVLGARELGRLAGYNVLISSGTLLGAIALQQPAVTAGALAYLVVSTLAIAALFLLSGLVSREEPEGVQQLEPYDAASDALFAAEDERRVAIPAPIALLGVCFLACALLLSGLPPLAGFLAKFALIAPMLAGGIGARVLFGLVIAAGLGVVIAMGRAGIQIFWGDAPWAFPHARAGETASMLALLVLCLALTVFAAGPWRYLAATAQQIHASGHYVDAVLATRAERAP